MGSVRPEYLRRQLNVCFVDEETRAAREVERVGLARVVGSKPRRDSRRYERRLGELRVASCGMSSHLVDRIAPRGGCLRNSVRHTRRA
jgi:hypothetical protein